MAFSHAESGVCIQALKWVQAATSEQIQHRLNRFGQMTRRYQEEGPQLVDATIPWETRRKLAIRLSQLNQDHVAYMLQVLEHLQPEVLPAPMAGTDLTIDIDKLTLETIERLQVGNDTERCTSNVVPRHCIWRYGFSPVLHAGHQALGSHAQVFFQTLVPAYSCLGTAC